MESLNVDHIAPVREHKMCLSSSPNTCNYFLFALETRRNASRDKEIWWREDEADEEEGKTVSWKFKMRVFIIKRFKITGKLNKDLSAEQN